MSQERARERRDVYIHIRDPRARDEKEINIWRQPRQSWKERGECVKTLRRSFPSATMIFYIYMWDARQRRACEEISRYIPCRLVLLFVYVCACVYIYMRVRTHARVHSYPAARICICNTVHRAANCREWCARRATITRSRAPIVSRVRATRLRIPVSVNEKMKNE